MIERVINTTKSIYNRPVETPVAEERIDDVNNSPAVVDEDGVEQED